VDTSLTISYNECHNIASRAFFTCVIAVTALNFGLHLNCCHVSLSVFVSLYTSVSSWLCVVFKADPELAHVKLLHYNLREIIAYMMYTYSWTLSQVLHYCITDVWCLSPHSEIFGLTNDITTTFRIRVHSVHVTNAG